MIRRKPRPEIALTALAVFAIGVTLAFTLRLQPAVAAQSSIVTVKMLDMPPSFDPRSVTIHVGDTVQWVNVGNAVHHTTDDPQMAVTSDDISSPKGSTHFDSGFMQPGEKFKHTFTQPGDYKYVCAAHEASGMTGEIIVR